MINIRKMEFVSLLEAKTSFFTELLQIVKNRRGRGWDREKETVRDIDKKVYEKS